MALNKDKLVFDESFVSDSDQVGSHILGSASAKVSSTNVGGKEGLDVNIINEIEVELDSEFAEDSAHASGDEGIQVLLVRQDTLAASTSADGDYGSFKSNNLGELYTHDTSAVAQLVAVNTELDTQTGILTTINTSLDNIEADADDIRISVQLIDNAVKTDNGAFTDGADQGFLVFGVDNTNTFQPFKMNAAGELLVAADISVTTGHEKLEDAAHASGDVGSYVLAVRQDTLSSSTSADGDYASFKVDSLGRLWTAATISSNVADDAPDTENPIKVGSQAVDGLLPAISASGDKANLISDMYRRLWVNSAPNIGFNVASATVTTTAAELASSPLAGRMKIEVQNLGNQAIYVGHSNAVTSSNGYRISAGATAVFEFGEDLDLWAIAGSGSQNVRILQLA